MAQAPPTFVSSKNDASLPAAHLHRQIEIQSKTQTPFLEVYGVETTPGAGVPKTLDGTILFNNVVIDTYRRYNTQTGIYTFPVNGYYIATFWGGPAGIQRYAEPGDVALDGGQPVGPSSDFMVTWQMYAGPTVPTFFNACSVISTATPAPGEYLCQLDIVCVAQY